MRMLPPWLRLPPSWPVAAALASSPASVSAAAQAERSNPGESRTSIRPPMVVFFPRWLPRRLARRARYAPAHAAVIVGGPRAPRRFRDSRARTGGRRSRAECGVDYRSARASARGLRVGLHQETRAAARDVRDHGRAPVELGDGAEVDGEGEHDLLPLA